MNINEFDITSMEEFPLKWRWIDPNYCQMPKSDLNRIKPLTIESATIIGKKALSFSEDNSCSLSSQLFENIVSAETDQTNIVHWLQSKLKISKIYISWNIDLAVITDVELFIRYWEHFCYPSSDDVSIWPFDESWVLSYCHYELFWYGSSIRL